MGASRYQAGCVCCVLLIDGNLTTACYSANVMISDDGKQPILMDFGSAIPARIPIKNRSAALAEQDRAAEHSTMPYRGMFSVWSCSLLV